MGIYLDPGNSLFQKAVNSEIYVDKSMLIDFTNRLVNTSQQNLCFSRPRRFGKSMMGHMLAAYYSKGCDSGKLFSSLKIANTGTYTRHLNRYHVIFLNMADFLVKNKTAEEMIRDIEKRLFRELKKEFTDYKLEDWTDLSSALEGIYIETGVPFVFIIDEWDAIFRKTNFKNRTQDQMEYLDFLRLLFKDKAYVGLAYMTGILPVKKYGEHSALNMFLEYSMEDMQPVQDMAGFTEEETQELCRKYGMPYDKMKHYYNGYQVNGCPIYNPNSVVNALTRKSISNYWTKTETYEALKDYIVLNFDGLKNAVTELIAGGRLNVDPITFSNDMVHFTSRDDVLMLLVHLGYLTFDFDTKEVWIPNKEVRDEFISSNKVAWNYTRDRI